MHGQNHIKAVKVPGLQWGRRPQCKPGTFTVCFCTLTRLHSVPLRPNGSGHLRDKTFPSIIPQTCPQPSSFYTHLLAYEDGTDSVPKRQHLKFRRRGITQKKTHNIQDTAKVWNQEHICHFISIKRQNSKKNCKTSIWFSPNFFFFDIQICLPNLTVLTTVKTQTHDSSDIKVNAFNNVLQMHSSLQLFIKTFSLKA